MWSDPATWGGSKPVAGAAVVIPAGLRVALDENTPALGTLTVLGELSFKAGTQAELRAENIVVRNGGALRAGSAAQPFAGRATITLTAGNADAASGMGKRGILVSAGGKLELFGTAPAVPWTRLAAHAEAGARTLTLERAVDWKAGDRIVVAPTEWYGNVWATQAEQDATITTEELTLEAAASGASVRATAGLRAFRWGLMQYVTDAGLSLTPGTFTRPHPDAVDRLDERAEVGNLSRNIVIQGADDDLWRTSGFGAHVMVMDLASALQLDGVELRRVGQAGVVGRYPIHWHMLSYDASGRALGDATGHFVRNSAIWNSRQRCLVVHGTNGVELRNNICHDIKGHAIFLEDAVERRNVIEGNLVLRVRAPVNALALAVHERHGHMCGSSAGYWLTNPDNTVRHNAVADAQGNGFWLSYPRRPVKQSAAVPMRPNNLPHAAFEFNSARSNGNLGVMLECAMTDDAGNLELLAYAPTADGSEFNWQNGVRFTLRGIASIKNGAGGYVNRAIHPDYTQWVMAGNIGRGFSGAVQLGSTLKHSLIIGTSLNNRQPYPTGADPQLGVASYHSTLDTAYNTFVNLPNRGYVRLDNGWDRSSGAFGTDDYYLRPLEKGYWRNVGNRFINADPGYRALPPHMQPNYTVQSRNSWTLSGALWDPHGLWGTPGRWWVLDHPFLRDASCAALASRVPSGLPNGLMCGGPYYGVGDFWLNRGLAGQTQQFAMFETLDVTRRDAAGNLVGQWRVEQGYDSNFLGHMRHFTALKGAQYEVRFPDFPNGSTPKTPPRWLQMWLDNFIDAGDSILMGVHFDGTATPSRVMFSTSPDNPNFGVNSRALAAAASRDAVVAGNGSLYWQDRANHLLWVKVTPLALPAWAGVVAGSDDDLYRRFALRVEP